MKHLLHQLSCLNISEWSEYLHRSFTTSGSGQELHKINYYTWWDEGLQVQCSNKWAVFTVEVTVIPQNKWCVTSNLNVKTMFIVFFKYQCSVQFEFISDGVTVIQELLSDNFTVSAWRIPGETTRTSVEWLVLSP